MSIPIKTILVTGANGQLGTEIQQIAKISAYDFLFVDRNELDISNFSEVSTYFEKYKPDYCINCAAYTAVDKAESDRENAFLINGEAVGNLSIACKVNHTRLIHISTDYVFNGLASAPYKEDNTTDPVNTYGASKLKGEELALMHLPEAVIIRTSWVFSSFGNNFVKTMIRLMNEKESINVVADQQGCPTYAADLAKCIMSFVERGEEVQGGIYNFCNSGITTWYDFALAIRSTINSRCEVHPISTEEFVTAAKRPGYSVLDTIKTEDVLKIKIPKWQDALARCIQQL